MAEQCYEVCLEVECGPIGINLQSLRGDHGAFVESFYRADDGGMLDAEGSGQIFVGDRISFIADDEVLTQHLDDIRNKLLLHNRPLKIRFQRIAKDVLLDDIALDPRTKLWIDAYLEDYCSKMDGNILRRKLYIYFLSRLLFDYLERQPDGCVQGNDTIVASLRELCLECLGCCINYDETLQRSHDRSYITNIECVCLALRYLENDLPNSLLVKFRQCCIARKLAGWMSDSPTFFAYSIVQIAEQQDLSACYYLHLITQGGGCQRCLHVLLNKRQRSTRRLCTSPESAKLRAIQQVRFVSCH